MKYRWLVAAALCIAAMDAGTAQAQSRRTLEEVAECAKIADATERLACYDAAAPKVKAVLERDLTEDEKISIFGLTLWDDGPGGSAEATKPEDFGRNDLPPTAQEQAEELTEITAKIVEAARNANGKVIFILDNGQVWKQIDSSKVLLPSDDDDHTVRIFKGLIGSYRITVVDSGRTHSVKRIR
jgi:hypothetical protein